MLSGARGGGAAGMERRGESVPGTMAAAYKGRMCPRVTVTTQKRALQFLIIQRVKSQWLFPISGLWLNFFCTLFPNLPFVRKNIFITLL